MAPHPLLTSTAATHKRTQVTARAYDNAAKEMTTTATMTMDDDEDATTGALAPPTITISTTTSSTLSHLVFRAGNPTLTEARTKHTQAI